MSFSPRGDALAILGGVGGNRDDPIDLIVHDFPSLRIRFEMSLEMNYHCPAELFDVLPYLPTEHATFDPQGSRLIVPLADGGIRILDASSGDTMSTHPAHSDVVCSVDVQLNDSTLLSASWDGTLKLWAL
jgi:WD40 repeat protein